MRHEHQPRKRFGQHFLTDQGIIKRIIDALKITPKDNLVEIGAGLGALTQGVLQQTEHLKVVEIDRDLVAQLRVAYPSTHLTVYEHDALKFEFKKLLSSDHTLLKIFGNLPYNISTPLLFHLLQDAPIIQEMIFMLQKEVVLRMCANPNEENYGRLSVMVQYACKTEHLFNVPPGAFSPPPKVQSSIIRLIPYHQNSPFSKVYDINIFSQVVAYAFQQRRKTLKNALSHFAVPQLWDEAKIDPIRRGETLSINEFIHLSNTIVKLNR